MKSLNCRQMDGTERNYTEWGNPTTERQAWYVLNHLWILEIEKQTNSLKSTVLEKVENKEDPKKKLHGSLKKWKGTRTPEQIGSTWWGKSVETWELEGEKTMREANMRDQEDWVVGGMEDSNKTDTSIDGVSICLERNMTIGKYSEIQNKAQNRI